MIPQHSLSILLALVAHPGMNQLTIALAVKITLHSMNSDDIIVPCSTLGKYKCNKLFLLQCMNGCDVAPTNTSVANRKSALARPVALARLSSLTPHRVVRLFDHSGPRLSTSDYVRSGLTTSMTRLPLPL